MATPIPGGTLFIALGLTALICSSPTAQYCIMWIRARTVWFNKLFFWLEKKVGSKVKVVGEALLKTHPPVAGALNISHRDFIRKMKEAVQVDSK